MEADIWLRCRAKCLRSQRAAKPAEARRTWLAGKLKCGYCGRALTVKCGKRKRGADVRYFLCSGKNTAGIGCAFRSLHADAVEALVLDALRDKLAGLPVLRPRQPPAPDSVACRLQAQLDAADNEIAALMRQLAGAGEALAAYIDRRVSSLEEQKAALCRRISARAQPTADAPPLTDYLRDWDRLPIAARAAAADCLIETIRATETELRIVWRV